MAYDVLYDYKGAIEAKIENGEVYLRFVKSLIPPKKDWVKMEKIILK